MAILIYLLKTTVVFVTLFSLYQVFLKNISFLSLRRWFLMSTLALSFLIPWISTWWLPKYSCLDQETVLTWIDETVRDFAVTSWITASGGVELANTLVITALAAGFVLVSAKYIFLMCSMRRLLKGSRIVSKNKEYTLRVGSKGTGSFCFLKTIYLCEPSLNEQNLHIILEHEKAHIRQKHYIDLWLSSACDYFFWFCPFTKPFQSAWEEVLECMADREAIRALQIEPITYQSALYANMEYSGMMTAFNNAFGRSIVARRLAFISMKPVSFRRVWPRLCFSFVVLCVVATSFTLLDVQIFKLQKIHQIRNAGYELHEVTTGYVIDSYTEEPVANATVEGGDNVAVTDGDGFFFIKKSSSKLRHVAYNKRNTTVMVAM